MYQKTSQADFLNAARQLKFKGENNFLDRNQLKYLLFEILAYPSVAKAEEHDRSSKIGSNDLLIRQAQLSKKVRTKNTADLQICNCCGLLLQNKQIPFSTKFDELNLGFGVILFFKDIFFYMHTFLLIFLLYSIYSICTNVLTFNQSQITRNIVCKQASGCYLSMIGAGSKVLNVVQQKKYLNMIQCFIGMALVGAWGIAQIAKTHLQQKQITEIQTKKISASDFTLMIDGFPKLLLLGSKQETISELNQIFQTFKNSYQLQTQHSFQVVNVNIARPIFLQNQKNKQHKEKAEQQLFRMQNIFRDWIRQRANKNGFEDQFQVRSRVYDEYHSFYSTIVQNQLFPNIDLQQRNVIFVTFRNSRARQDIQSICKPPSVLRFWKWFQKSPFPVKNVRITKAPQPDQIKWNNIGFSTKKRVIRKILVWLATIGLIILSLLVSLAVSYVKQKSTWLSLVISLIVTIVNIGIQIVIINLTYNQHQVTQSWQQSNIAFKIGIGQVVNSVCVPILVTALSQTQENPKPWLKSNGLVQDIFFIGLLNILIPLTTLIDPYEYFLKLKRWYVSDPQRRLQMFGQDKLNAYYGNYKFDIGYQYAFIIKTTIFTSFFLCMQPLIAIFAPIALGFYYLSMKKKLFYHFARPGYHFATTNRTANNILLFALPAFGLGSLFVNNGNSESQGELLNRSTLALNYIIILIGVGFLIVVPFKIFYCCISRPKVINKVYEDCRMMLYNDYDRANPITKNSAINEFQSYIKSLEQQKNLSIEGQLVKLHLSTLKTKELRKSSTKNLHPYKQIEQEKEKTQGDIMYNYDINYYNKIAKKNKTAMNEGEDHIMDQSFIKNEQFSHNKF